MGGGAQEFRIHVLFELLAADLPQQTAVIFEDQTYTYRQINRQANRLAYSLLDKGVATGSPVGLYMDHSPQLIVAILAILKTGGVCIPLQPGYPAKRLAKITADTGLSTIVSQGFSPADIAPAHIQRIPLDLIDLSSAPAENLAQDISPESLAFVLYTSGSTGEPKGVKRSHRGMTEVKLQAPATRTTALLMRSAISHVGFAFELINPIIARCPVVIIRAGGERDNRYLIQLIRKHDITRIYLTPTHLRELLDESDFAACTVLESVGVSGEAMPPSLQKRFFAVSNVTLTSAYGCTEFPNAASWVCRPDDDRPWHILGRPTPGTVLYLLDESQAEVARGEVGEIYLGGKNLADGYWGRPDLTADRFVANPFSDEKAPILYRTGDMARCHEDGTLEYVGRADAQEHGRQLSGQVKIRGFRVELGEIETVLDRHPLVDLCAVIAVADREERGDWRIIAYFSSTVDRSLMVNDLRDHLARDLPDFMIPAVFIRLDRLPTTLTGKIDRTALPDLDRSRPQQDERFVATRGPVEEVVARSWREVLELDEIGVNDNFFLLGGHSLMAMRIVNHLQEELNVELRIIHLFEQPTVAGLAAVVQNILDG